MVEQLRSESMLGLAETCGLLADKIARLEKQLESLDLTVTNQQNEIDKLSKQVRSSLPYGSSYEYGSGVVVNLPSDADSRASNKS